MTAQIATLTIKDGGGADRTVQAVDLSGAATELTGRGRHDPCVVPRAVPIIEAMAALVLADHWLRHAAQNRTFRF